MDPDNLGPANARMRDWGHGRNRPNRICGDVEQRSASKSRPGLGSTLHPSAEHQVDKTALTKFSPYEVEQVKMLILEGPGPAL
jgi:hypothetical protein